MKMMKLRNTAKIRAVITLLCSAFVPFTLSQTPEPFQPTLSARSTLVLVPALVRNKAGNLIFTLSANDFTLTDDGVAQKLKLEQGADQEPLALLVLIEIGGAGAREFNKYDSIAPPLAPMLESIIGNVPHKVAVVTFDSHPTLLQSFTANINNAADAIETLTPGCTRQHHLDNCALATRHSQRRSRRQRSRHPRQPQLFCGPPPQSAL
jgi:hypothetical protein